MLLSYTHLIHCTPKPGVILKFMHVREHTSPVICNSIQKLNCVGLDGPGVARASSQYQRLYSVTFRVSYINTVKDYVHE